MAKDEGPGNTGPGRADAYLHVRLTGERFDPEGMPASAMPEVAVLTEVLFQLAREEWLAAHPGRVQVPDGFADLFDVRLVAIEDGSASPVLVLKRRPDRAGDDDADAIYEAMSRAPKALSDLLVGVRDDHALPSSFQRKYVPKLAKIGKTLADDEILEVGPAASPGQPPTGETVKVTPAVRNTLEAIDRALREFAEPVEETLEGVVTEFDGRRRSFQLSIPGQRQLVSCEIAASERTLGATVKAVLAEDGVTAPDVGVQGWIRRDPGGTIVEIRDVIEVTIVRTFKEKQLLRRVELLESLEDGWWEPSSLKPQAGVLAAVRRVYLSIAALDPLPVLTARTDGSVAFEVSHQDMHCLAVIEGDGDQMYLLADDGSQSGDEEFEGDFNAPRLVRFLGTGRIQ
jgi:hypothetical protein